MNNTLDDFIDDALREHDGVTLPMPKFVSRSSDSPLEHDGVSLPGHAIGDLLGRGGMGAVYLARQAAIERDVAVKVMTLDADEPELAERFRREAQVLGRLAHPNIVPIHELGVDAGGRPFYTMKLVKGRTLQAIITALREGDAATVREHTLASLLTVFRKVCDAMAFAHSQGVLHRDLKPENVMVGEFGEVLVMDWGLAKTMNDEGGRVSADAAVDGDAGSSVRLQTSSFQGTLQGSVMGTPQFMSPEQARGEIAALDERADVYSLGAILYAILTLRPPVEGRTLDEVLAKVARAQVTSPSDLPVSTMRKMARGKGDVPEVEQARPLPHIVGGRVPAALSLVAMKALALEKTKRYRHVADFSADIAAYQGGFATSAENAGFAKQAALLIKRHKGIFTTAAAAWLLVSALAVWFMWNLRAKERRAVAGEQHATKAEAVAVQERETARRALAKSQLDLAEKEFTRGKFVEAQKILGETPESFRDANWRFLSTHSQDFSAQLSIRGKGSTHRLQFLPGGDRFAVKCWAGVVGVFTITGEQVGDWIPASGGHSVPFGIDSAGDKIAVVASASEVAVMDVASAKLLRRWTCESNDLWHVLLSADGQTVLAVDRRQTFAYAAQTGALLWKTPSSLITPAISPDSRTVALVAVKSGLTLKVELRDLTTGEVRSSLEATADNPDKSVLQFNQAGDQLACFGGDEMILWNPKTAAKIRALHFPGEQVKALSPVGSLVATISGGRIGLWDAETGRLLRSLQGATTDVTELAFSRDAKTLLSSHVAANDGVVHVWPVRLREEIVSSHTVGTKGRRIAFGQDGSRFYACAGNAAEWETRGGREIWRFSSGEANLLNFALHPTDGSIVVSDFKKKVFAHVSPDRQAREDFGSSWDSGLGFNRSGQLLLVVDQAVAQINPGAAFSVVEYPSGKVLHKTSFPSEGRQPFAQFCLDDAAVATAALAGGITVWDWKAGKPLRQIAAVQTGSIACLASSPDGRHLASGGPDRWIRVWEAETGRLETAFRAHWEGVRSVKFSSDGREILSGSEDGTVRLHDAATGEERLAFSGHTTPVVDVNISNDGRLIGALTSDGFTKVWDRQRSSISPVLVNDTDNWEDLLAPLTPEIVNQTGHGWSMKDGELFCPDTKYAMLPLSANVSGTSYRVRVNLRQLPANEVFHIVLPVADRMCGFELEARPHGSIYSGVIMVNGKYGKDMPGVVEGKLVNDLATHALEVIVRLKGANVTISSTLDTRPLYTWTGPATALKQTRSWATTPHGELALGSFRLGWVVSAVKLKRE